MEDNARNYFLKNLFLYLVILFLKDTQRVSFILKIIQFIF